MIRVVRFFFVLLLSSLYFVSAPALAADKSRKAAVGSSHDVVVIGDSLAAGLWQGLHQNFRDIEVPSVTIHRETKVNTGIVRSDRHDWMRHVEKLARAPKFDIAVLMFGANDAQSIRLKGKRHHYKTPGWEEQYRLRIDRMITALTKKNIKVYWVGLPNVQKEARREDYQHFNAIFKERAEANGVRFIDTWGVTNDEEGEFRPYGQTVDGKKAILRAKDGTHFTPAGYRVLARYAEKALIKDLTTTDVASTVEALKTTAQ